MAAGQFRTVGLGQLFADEGGLAGIGRAGNLLDGSRTAFGGDGVEAGGTHGDHLDRSRGLHGSDGVTGVDRTLEGVGADHFDDLGDLVDVQQRGDARQEVLAVGGSRGQHVAVVLAQLGDQRRDVFRQLVGVGGVVGDQHLGDALDLGGGFGHGGNVLSGDQHVDVAANGLGSGNGVQGGSRQGRVVVLSDNQDSH